MHKIKERDREKKMTYTHTIHKNEKDEWENIMNDVGVGVWVCVCVREREVNFEKAV